MTASEKRLLEAEKRFKKACNLSQDISVFPLKNNVSNIETNKIKSKEFSEVFTPLWLVDQMIRQVKFTDCNVKTLDLCAGYGQFSIRLMRYLHQIFPDFNSREFLKNNHAFSELQLSSCYKLLNSFTVQINLFIGDSTYLNKLPSDAKGIWCYIESWGYWACLTNTIKTVLSPNGIKAKPISEDAFVSSVDSIIQNLNKAHLMIKEMNNVALKQVNNPKGRLQILSKINALTANTSAQTVDTPESIIVDMLDCVDDLEKKSILVLFNTEFVEALIHKYGVDPKSITFGADVGSALEIKAVNKIYGVDTVTFSKDPIWLQSAFKGKKFDVCFSNPPYNDNLHIKILMAVLGRATIETSIAKQFIVIHPMNWLIDLKAKEALFHNFKSLIGSKLVSITAFNGNPIFDITLHYPCGITKIDLNHDHKSGISVSYFKERYKVNSINVITKYGGSWSKLVEPFMRKINSSIISNGDITKFQVKAAINGKHYCQLAGMRGHESQEVDNQVKTDFYTVLMQKTEECKGLRKAIDSAGMMTFALSSQDEVDNFIGYLQTDFARFCLSLYKINGNNHRGELKIIPAMDFSQTWDDEKLFKHFDINQETQDYIRKFLPDYYGIRDKSDGITAQAI